MTTYAGGSRMATGATSIQERGVRTSRQPREPKPMSATARKTLATKQLVNALGSDEKAAITAALEVVNERLGWDAQLRQSIQQKYEELAALNVPKPKVVRTAPMPQVDGSAPARRATLEKLNPYDLLEDVGPRGLRAALDGNTQRRLRSAVDIVQARKPGTKPASRSRNDAMIDYIVEQLAGPGH